MGIFIEKKLDLYSSEEHYNVKKIPGQADINNKSSCQQISVFEV